MASRELPLPRGTAVARTSIEEDVLLPFFPVRFQNPGPSLNFQNYVSSSSREHPTVGYLFFPFSFFFSMAFLVVHYGPVTLRGYFHNYYDLINEQVS